MLFRSLTFSEHALVLCDDLAGLLKKMWEGLRVSPDQIGTELIAELGPRGQFLAEQHTVENCRAQVWDSRYLGANFPLSNNDLPDEDLIERLERDIGIRLQQAPPPPLDPTILATANKVLARYEGLTPDD